MIGAEEPIPEVIAIGVSRGLRIRRIGRVYFVEAAHIEREADHEQTSWKTVAIAKDTRGKPGSARNDAFQWMHKAQAEIWAMQKGGMPPC